MILYTSRECSVEVFRLGAGAALPLHDHPGMAVLTQILHGSMQLVAVDANTGTVVTNDALSAPALWVTHPQSNNLHAFRSVGEEGVTFLDIIAPPYDFSGHPPARPCTYFSVTSVAGLGAADNVWDAPVGTVLRLGSAPRDAYDIDFRELPYTGEAIVLER